MHLGEFLAPGALRSEREDGGKCSEMRIRTPTPAGRWISLDLLGGGWNGAWALGSDRSASVRLGDFRQVA